MQVDHVLILAAGLGTRMGSIGRILPKPLWPFFEKTILELVVDYLAANQIHYKNLFVNLHHQADQIEAFIQQHPRLQQQMRVLKEDPILDIGGAIHNLAQQANVQYCGRLLVLNCDQFLFFAPHHWTQLEAMVAGAANVTAALLAIPVEHSQGYNRLDCGKSGIDLCGITQWKAVETETYPTYSGCSLIELARLQPQSGVSKFFDSVANFQHPARSVKVLTLDDFEYWDLGTLQRYRQTHFDFLWRFWELWQQMPRPLTLPLRFAHFALATGAFLPAKMQGPATYASYPMTSSGPGWIDLSAAEVGAIAPRSADYEGPVLILRREANVTPPSPGIHYLGVVDV